ncbi:MAG: hypothetical protein HYU52_06265 [Acidobacteria bacterium]|nr:hypothetical protein [Acidobacteriota bacterium]
MIRKTALVLTFVLATAAAFDAGAIDQTRRRPVTSPQLTIDGLIAAASADALRVQTSTGTVTVSLDATTEIVRAGNRSAATASTAGQYTLTDALVAPDGSISARRVTLFDVPASAAAEETLRVEGKVATVSPDASTLAIETRLGLLTVSVNETTVIRRDGVPIALADIPVGSFVRIIGKPTGERTLLALQIDVRSAEQPPHRDAVAGEVVEVRAADQALVIRREVRGPRSAADDLVVVRTNAETEIYRHRERIRFADIAAGDFVLAIGAFDASGALVAMRIDVANRPDPAPRIAGRVLEVSQTEKKFTVAVERSWMRDVEAGPVTVVVTDDTKIYREREQVRFAELKAGDFVHVAGEWDAAKALVASVIYIASPPTTPPMPMILGEIISIETATRTLVVRVRAMRPHESSLDGTVKVIAGDDTTIFRNGAPSRFAELKVGEVVSVVGEVRDDGAILARRIDVIVPPQRPNHVGGDVSAVGAQSIEIIVPTINPTFQPVRVTILVEDATEIYKDGERARLAAIRVGDVLVATGSWKNDSTFSARRIDARSRPDAPAGYVRGTIEMIERGGLRLVDPGGQRWGVSVSPLTIIIRDGRPLRFDELRVGDLLDVLGLPKGEHMIAAVSIRVVQ